MNYVKFVSSHHSNVDTSIIVTKNHLILEDEKTIVVFDLNNLIPNTLDNVKTLSIKSNPVNVDNLVIEYDNRGEPYMSGVTLTVDETSVFLDKQDFDEFIKVVNNNTNK